MKTSKLTGAALNWAIYNALHPNMKPVPSTFRHQHYCGQISFSTNWSQGGPIIERERITLVWTPLSSCWSAYWDAETTEQAIERKQDGLTPLIAAMRCYVASVLGDEVDIPEELL